MEVEEVAEEEEEKKKQGKMMKVMATKKMMEDVEDVPISEVNLMFELQQTEELLAAQATPPPSP